MATLEARLQAVVERIATETKNLKTKQGTLTNLTTTEKSNLVLAINELKSVIDSLNPAEIDDVIASGTTVFSSNRTISEINTRIANALEGEDLSDLADQVLALVQADEGLVSALSAQSFTTPQQTQARANIGAASSADLSTLNTNIGNTDRNFVTDFDNIYNA